MRFVVFVALALMLGLPPRVDAASCEKSCAHGATLCLQTAKRAGKALKIACTGTGKVRKTCRRGVAQAMARQVKVCQVTKAFCRDCCERDGAPCGSWCGDGTVDESGGEQCDPPVQAPCKTGGSCRIDCRCPPPILPPVVCGDGVVDAGEACDLGAANGQPGSCCAADCTFVAAGVVCRAASDTCDAAETCAGNAAACPPDLVRPADTTCADDGNPCTRDVCDGTDVACRHEPGNAGATCRAAAGACDVAETCTGTSAECPPDVVLPSTTVCRSSAGVCDVAELCDGASGACPPDARIGAGTDCGDDGNPCTIDTCDGVAAICPHRAGNAGVTCRSARDECDAAELCNGVATACPPDVRRNAGAGCTDDGSPCTADTCDGSTDVCRHTSNGTCMCGNGHPDPAEDCDLGTANGAVGSCCTNTCTFVGAGQACRPSAGDCDVAELCSGNDASCPADGWLASGVVCRSSAGACDVVESCSGTGPACPPDAFKPPSICRSAAGDCDLAESCSGLGPACPPDQWIGGGIVCRTGAGACDLVEYCTGNGPACPPDVRQSSGTVCRSAAGACDVAESCDGVSVACPGDTWLGSGTLCRSAAGECDAAELCTGASPSCPPDTKRTLGAVCADDANPCTVDQCDGLTDQCPHAPGNAGVVCRASRGECDPAEACTGNAAACPLDMRTPADTHCTDDGTTCTDDTCDGTHDACQHPSNGSCKCGNGVVDAGEACDRGAANGTTGSCCAGDCTMRSSGTVCRPSAGACDVVESCTGLGPDCPPDGWLPSTTVCRSVAGACDVAESCSGASPQCPGDGFAASGTVCRSTAGVCDVAESCDGTSAACPANVFAGSERVCRSAAGVCDVTETCAGSSATCPADAKQPSGTLCRSAAGVCDVAESCDGTSAACPVDVKVASGTVCRSAVDVCDLAETCTGAATCPPDVLRPSGTICRSAAGACDVAEACTGSATVCPADVKQPSGSVCRSAAGVCDVTESCNGSSVTCPSDVFTPSGTVCRSTAGVCDVAEACTGTNAACPADVKQASGTVCRSAAGVCDAAESCNGSSVACPADVKVASGTVCRAGSGDACDPSESCNGTSATCPGDVIAPGGTQCRPAGACPPAELCTGVAGAKCPADVCAPSDEILGCVPLESGAGQRVDLPDVWNVAVQAGVQVSLTADTVDAATAGDLCFRIQCPGQPLVSGDDELACSFAPPAGKKCPQKIFTPASSGTCQVTVGVCSTACADARRVRYALRVTGAVPTLASDDGVPVATASGSLACGPLGDRYTFAAASGQEVVVRTDTVDAASAASICVTGSCTSGERFTESDTATCSAGGAAYGCVEKHFVPASSGTCTVQVSACNADCAGALASYRLDVAGTSALTLTGDGVGLGSCGNGTIDPLETCGENGLPSCPATYGCVGCACQKSMPDLTGLRADTMRTTLQNAGIRLGTVTPLVEVRFPPAQALAQSIAPNATVRSGDAIDVTLSLPPDTGELLTHLGNVQETESSALAYYDTIDPCDQRLTLSAWVAANGFVNAGGNEASAVYENHNDLGFGRRMSMRRNAADSVAYYVQNFKTVDDAWQHPERILATVAMEYSRPVNPVTCQPDAGQPPFIKFFTYGPDGSRITKVDLDGRGEKHQPEMCTVCHGGFPGTPVGGVYPNKGDVGARFIPFDLDSFAYSHLNPLVSRANQAGAFKELNRGVVAQTSSVGGAASTSCAAHQLVCGWYGDCSEAAPCSCDLACNLNGAFDGTFVPNGWSGLDTTYADVVKQGCRGCHAQQGFPDFADSSSFFGGGPIQSYVCDQGRMPLALRTFQNFWLGQPGRGYGPVTLANAFGAAECSTSGPSGQQQLNQDPNDKAVKGPLPSDPAMGIGGPRAVAIDDDRNVYVTGFTSSKVMKYVPSTGTATVIVDSTGGGVAPLTNASGIAVDHAGNVFVAGFNSNDVLRIAPGGGVTKVIDAIGDGPHPFTGPQGDCLGVDDAGDLYAAATTSNGVFKRTPAGVITQILGTTGDGVHGMSGPFSVATARDGTTWVSAFASNNVFRIAPSGIVTQVIDSTGDGQGHTLVTPTAIAVSRQGTVAVVGQGSKTAFRIFPDGRIEWLAPVTITDASLGTGVTFDEAENVYVSIRAESNVYQVTPGGTLSHVFNPMDAGIGAGPYDMAVDPRTRIVWIALREKTGLASLDFGF